MEKLTFVRFERDFDTWYRIDKEDIVESFPMDDIKRVDDGFVKKHSIEEGDSKKKLLKRIDNDSLEDAFSDVETYIGNYIDLNEIDENGIYYDDYCDEFYYGHNILMWDRNQYYWHHDGSNWRMEKIEEIQEIEAKEVEIKNYGTGVIETYETKNGDIFKIDRSFYQGTKDNVIEEYDHVICNYEENATYDDFEDKVCDSRCKHYLSQDGKYPIDPCGECSRFYADKFERKEDDLR
jgi:DNA-directed RNA polymerase subunit H (RpoH/RPB5)